MTIAAKHFDPQLGIDIHTYITPPFVLPTPHIGLVLDPFDYIPFIGSTVMVNGVHRATAGTGGLDIHIPVGVWAPPMSAPMGPQFDGEEIFMGSRTVSADGEPFSKLAMPVLDCNVAGMINPFRMKKPKKPLRALSLPTGLNVAIPTNVVVGGPPTISWTAMAFKAAFAGLGKIRKSAFFRKKMDDFAKWRKGKWGNLPPSFLKCKVLRAEPVDIRDGSVSVTHQDFDLPGRLAFAWQRHYGSRHSGEVGACGVGWQTPADIRLELLADGSAWLSGPEQAAFFPELPPIDGEAGAILDFVDGARLLKQKGQWRVRFKGGLQYVFGSVLADGVAALPRAQILPIERIEDAHGNHWRFERRDGHLVRIVESGVGDLQGRFITVESRQGRIEQMALHDPATGLVHPLVSYRYDAAADLIAAIDPLGAPRTFVYEQHRMVQHTDRVGLSFYYAFDAQGRVVHSWGDGGLYNYHFEYDELLRETRVTDSLGHLSVVKFDENKLPLCEIDPLDGVTLFEYDDFGRTVAVTDPEGLRTEFAYDATGNLLCLTRPDDSTIQMEYDLQDNMVVLHTPEGAQWRQQYDEKNQLVAQVDPLGAITSYQYDAQGQLISQTNARQAVTRLRYDRHGLIAAIVDALGYESAYEQDPLGNLLRQVDPLGQVTRYEYDIKGRMTASIGTDGAGVRCEYDAEDQLVRYTDEAGAQTRIEYVGIGKIGKRHQADGYAVEYRYDTEEQLVAVINQCGQSYRLLRDPLGRIVEEVDYWGQSRFYSYDAAGRLTSAVDPLGQRISFDTDKLGRITRKTLPDVHKFGRRVEEYFVYNKEGQVVELRNPARTARRRYDLAGRLILESQDEFDVAYAYDCVGNRLLRETSAGNRVALSFDLCNQADQIKINDESPVVVSRDALGRVISERFSPHVQQQLEYNFRNQLTFQAVLKDAMPIFETSYDYDCSGNLIRRNDSSQGIDGYRYDAIGRLLQHSNPRGKVESFINDPVGDRLRTEVKQVQARQVVGGSEEDSDAWIREGMYLGARYVFDRAGNLIDKSCAPGQGDEELVFTWDANSRLATSVRGGEATYYGYDALGRRVFKRNSSHTKWFFWDGNALLGEVLQLNSGKDVAPIWLDNVASLTEARARIRKLESLHKQVREYVYQPASYVPLATIIPKSQRAEADSLGGKRRELLCADAKVADIARDSAAESRRCDISHDSEQSGHLSGGDRDGFLVFENDLLLEVSPARQGASRPKEESLPAGVLGALGASVLATGPEKVQTTVAGAEAEKLAAPTVGLTADLDDSVIRTNGVDGLSDGTAGFLENEDPEKVVYFYSVGSDGCPRRILTSKGRVVWEASVAAYGQASILLCEIENNLRFPGQYFDAETDLHYNRNRYYDSAIGSYVSTDPIGLRGGLNLYGYGRNPIGFADPLGLIHEEATGYSVYGLYDAGSDKPYYVGITNDLDRRRSEHIDSGRLLDDDTTELRPIKEDVTYGEARGIEQANIEEHKTKTGKVGDPISQANRGNKINSFDVNSKTRPADRQKYFVDAFKKAKAALEGCRV